MPVSDQREIRFDAAATVAIMMCSQRMAEAIGLPRRLPNGARFDPSASEVVLLYDDNKETVAIPTASLAALLIGYCMRAGIRVPRHLKRSVRVDRDAVVLVFSTTYPTPPLNLLPERAEDANLSRSWSWLQPGSKTVPLR
jgi:hypothetical protein